MHGRLKVKTTEQQKAEKAKERAIKVQKYLAGMNQAMQKRREDEDNDNEIDEITAKLLMANPDVQSLWNQRRELILKKKRTLGDTEDFSESLKSDLRLTETCLYENPKSYGAWHHRAWVLHQFASPPWKEEMDLCNKYLSLDGRNFHCWDHRRYVVRESNISPNNELDYTLELIENNFSNYSAWHYRSQLLPLLHPPAVGSPLPIEDSIFLEELKRVVTAVFTDPNDQSPWFFLRWLICIHHLPKVLQMGVVKLGVEKCLVVTYTSTASLKSLKELSVQIGETPVESTWLQMDTRCTIWKFPLPKEGSVVKVKGPDFDEEFRMDGSTKPKWISAKSFESHELLPVVVQKALEDLIENFTILDEIDPDNKWVLLTLVDLMSSISVSKHYEDIEKILMKLQKIDPLRSQYYEDKRSSFKLSLKLRSCISENQLILNIPSAGLTLIDKPQYLVFMEEIDLSNNFLISLSWAKNLVNCSHLRIEGNKSDSVSDDLSTLLKRLSIEKCNTTQNEPVI